MTTRGQDIVSVIKQQIEQFGQAATTMVDVGTVIEVGDGIARIHGLMAAKYNELLQFPHDIMAIAMNLEEDSVAAVILGDYTPVKEGDEVRCTGRIAEVPVGEALIGRVVDPLGRPLDGKGPTKTQKTRPIERVAPNVAMREAVNTPVQTGIKAIDSIIPIGRGQRELIIGDRSTGKTTITLDTIINQKGGDLICIYVAIGQKTSKVARVVATLEQYGAMVHTIVVAANASDSAACSIWRLTLAVPSARSSWSRARTHWSSTTTYPSTPGLTASFLYSCAVRRGGKRIRVMCSTCTVACWRGRPNTTRNMVVVH